MALALPGAKKLDTLFTETGNMSAVGLEAVRKIFSRPWPVAEFIDQCWFIIKVTTLPVIMVSIPFGVVLAIIVGQLIVQLGAEAQLGSVMAQGIINQQASLADALLIAGAAGSAICSDLGARNIRDEVAALRVMGINPIQRLVMPRVVASTLVSTLLISVVILSALGGTVVFNTTVFKVPISTQFNAFNTLLGSTELYFAYAKAMIFGFIAGVVACYKGLYCKTGPKGVGEAVNQSVVVTFLLLFFVNTVMIAIRINFIPSKFG